MNTFKIIEVIPVQMFKLISFVCYNDVSIMLVSAQWD